jgi:hypothetical protein
LETRIIKNDRTIISYKDAQGFKKNGKKLRVKPVYAFIHHYGWVKPPKAMQAKQESFHKLWHSDEWVNENIANTDEFDYSQIDSLAFFRGTHPEVMKARIARQNWKFSFDPTMRKMSFKSRLLHFAEEIFGLRFGEWKNYRIVK